MNEAPHVIVLGTGGAGFTAALSAYEAGARVSLFEKGDQVGGTTAWSGGMIWIPNNHHEGALGVEDSRDKALTQSQVAPFFTSNKYTFPVLLDGDQSVSRSFGVKACPATFIVTPKGKIILTHHGYKSGQEKEIKQQIDDFLAGTDVKEISSKGETK